jgi:CMP-N-acetylneuraminic acid synthetase
LIPARAGSKRIAGKNTRIFAGHPLIAHTIAPALAFGRFARVLVSTECPETARIARAYGAEVPWLRPKEFAQDDSPDIDWLRWTLFRYQETYGGDVLPEAFALLRPTSPFRKIDTLARAWDTFFREPMTHDSLRAVEPCGQHPGKMWRVEGDQDSDDLTPLMTPTDPGAVPWHSQPTQCLPSIYVQNASLEMAWTRVPLELGSLAGQRVRAFFTQGVEGYDVNTRKDWFWAEHLLASCEAQTYLK